jgi:ubiquinone/menaquinone biosynthesis C-methylase UbiE
LPSEIEDFTKEWTFPPESVDYIHLRWLLGSVADWDAFFKEAARTLKPGGIVESHEPQCHIESEDGTVKEDSALGKWGPMFVKAGESWGRPFDIIDKGIQEQAMKNAGLVDVCVKDITVGASLLSWGVCLLRIVVAKLCFLY